MVEQDMGYVFFSLLLRRSSTFIYYLPTLFCKRNCNKIGRLPLTLSLLATAACACTQCTHADTHNEHQQNEAKYLFQLLFVVYICPFYRKSNSIKFELNSYINIDNMLPLSLFNSQRDVMCSFSISNYHHFR